MTAVQAHTQALAVLQQAVREKALVWVGYVDAHGGAASRLLRPVSIGAGYLRAEDERTDCCTPSRCTGSPLPFSTSERP